MPRDYAPEDNPWTDYIDTNTWQEMIRDGHMVRLSDGAAYIIDVLSRRSRLISKLMTVSDMNNFISMANVGFLPSSKLCLLSTELIQNAWADIQTYMKSNFIEIILSTPSKIHIKNFSAQFIVDLNGNVVNATDDEWWSRTNAGNVKNTLTISWPTLSNITTIGETELGYSILNMRSDRLENKVLSKYVTNLDSADDFRESITNIQKVFSTIIEVSDSEGNVYTGLLSANSMINQKLITDSRSTGVHEYNFYICPNNDYWNSGITDSIKTQIGVEPVIDFESLSESVQDLNDQISTHIEESDLSFNDICYNYFSPSRQHNDSTFIPYSVDLGIPVLETITGSQADRAVKNLKILLTISELQNDNINFIGNTGTDIGLGWSYPIKFTDCNTMNYPDSNRGTNLRTIFHNQVELPTLQITYDEIIRLMDIFMAIQAIQSKIPQLDASIKRFKNLLESNRSKLSQLQDPEKIRDRVNSAARAARATTRDSIARDISRRESEYTHTLAQLQNYLQQKSELLTKYLNE